jgi:hypothetical protein
MKELDQSLRELVLRAISDDYENFDRILEDVTGWAAERHFTPDRLSILRALEGLISDGYAQAYLLSSGPPGKAEAVMYSADCLDELWFYVTLEGKQLTRKLQKEWNSS